MKKCNIKTGKEFYLYKKSFEAINFEAINE